MKEYLKLIGSCIVVSLAVPPVALGLLWLTKMFVHAASNWLVGIVFTVVFGLSWATIGYCTLYPYGRIRGEK